MTKLKVIALAITIALFLISGAASAQTISIVSGNGQLQCTLCPLKNITSLDPLVVQVKGPTGAPLQGATVTWTFTNVQGTGAPGNFPITTTTDANGMASITTTVPVAFGQLSFTTYAQAHFTATLTALPSGTQGSTGQSVTFTETDALTDVQATGQGSGIVEVGTTLVAPAGGTTITGPAGSTLNGAIQVRVNGFIGGTTGTGIPGVAVIVEQPSSAGSPSISCAPGPGGQPNIALTDATGTATCNVVFGGAQGNGTATVAVGQTDNPFATYPINFTTTQGVPGGIQITSGNNQSGNAGSPLPSPLVATVTDQAGNPISGVNVTWTVTSGTATLFNQRTTSDANGRVSANVTLGANAGPVQITIAVASTPNINGTFTATVSNPTVSQLQILAGNNQSAIVGAAFPNSLVVQVNNAGAPVSGATVAFAVSSGTATLSAPSAITNAQGQAQVTVTAGNTPGTAVVTATIGTLTQSFTLTISPPGPIITPASFYNTASLISGAISPCSLATIIATGLAPGLQGSVQPPLVGLLPVLVNNDSVLFSQSIPGLNTVSAYAPIWNVANIGGQEQLTFEVPCELSPGNVNVTVNVGSGSKTVALNLQPAAPGIFQFMDSDRVNRAVIVRPDGSFASKNNPARQGETVSVFVTGLGPVNPPIGTNQIGIPGQASITTDNIVVGVNNSGQTVVSAAYAPDLVGIYQISFIVPTGASGDLPLAVAVNMGGNLVFGNGSIIPVQ